MTLYSSIVSLSEALNCSIDEAIYIFTYVAIAIEIVRGILIALGGFLVFVILSAVFKLRKKS